MQAGHLLAASADRTAEVSSAFQAAASQLNDLPSSQDRQDQLQTSDCSLDEVDAYYASGMQATLIDRRLLSQARAGACVVGVMLIATCGIGGSSYRVVLACRQSRQHSKQQASAVYAEVTAMAAQDPLRDPAAVG